MRLSEQSGYTWVATISDDARTYDIDGKTSREGFSAVKMPAINAVRRKLGRDVTDNRVEAIFRGNSDCVLHTEDGWLRPDQLPEAEGPSSYERAGAIGSVGVSKKRKGGASGGGPGGSGIHLPGTTPDPGESRRRDYSNLQLAISPPHEELAVIVSSHSAFKVEGDTVTGTLTELGARLLLVRDGQSHITPLQASGDFKIWLRGGLPIRYQTNLKGTLQVTSSRGQSTVAVQQRTLTNIRDIGTTVVEIPDIARIALAR